MVTRKPLPSSAQNALGPLSSNPPYPTTPTATDAPPAFRVQDVRNELQSPTDSQPITSDGWGGDGILVDGAVNHNSGKAETSAEIPESLRPGKGPPGYTPKFSQENLTNNPATSNNPFLKQQQHPGGYDGRESSAQAWGSAEDPAGPSNTHPPLPVFTETPPTPLSHQFSNLSVSERSTNPWQPALDEKASTQDLPDIPSVQLQDSGDNAWTAPPPERKAPVIPGSLTSNEHPVIVDAEEDDSPAWDEDESVYELPTTQTEESQQLREDQHAWDGQNGSPKKQAISFDQPLSPVDAVQQADGWNIVEHETLPQTSQQSGIIGADGTEIEIISNQEHVPALPPRTSEEHPPPQPPRPMANTSTSSSTEPSAAAIAVANAQKKETYDIKKITWHDVNAERNPRISPILVQNANGPCPLLALVNALTLSTPAGMNTALVETLQSREQVSLGLLIEAVFDELMSGRRGDAAQELPDVSDLYSFLLALHTGMNVNPTFIPPAPPAKELRKSMSHVHPSERVDSVPGTFEETREMKLYSTFSIPLIHGWLPEKDSPAYVALARSAKTYEDAQNIMFREEELEDKLQREGLSFEEQATLEDIATIKAFLSTAATQLTQHGLNTITTSLSPAGVAILFRNDHFSTLYRHPETLQLLQLVTDMGYAGHEEVVWESLIDVNGENADFFSGDFRLVGGAPASPVLSQSGQTSGWNTRVQGHQSQPSAASSHQDPIPPTSPNTEQEDHDMALALQLQEEEEERHRSEIARRRRETELSQQYIEQQGAQSNSIPVSQRGGGSARGRTQGQSRPSQQNLRQPSQPRPAIPPRRAGAAGRPVDPEAGIDAPPPTYDEAATTPAYVPPPDHPSHPSADPNAPQRRTSAYSVSSASQVQNPGRGGRVNTAGRGRGAPLIDQIPGRRPSVPVQQQNQERDRDCLVM